MTKQRVGTLHSKYNTNDNQVGDDLRGLNGLLGKKSICSSLVLRTSRGCQTVTRVVGSCAESPNRSLPPIISYWIHYWNGTNDSHYPLIKLLICEKQHPPRVPVKKITLYDTECVLASSVFWRMLHQLWISLLRVYLHELLYCIFHLCCISSPHPLYQEYLLLAKLCASVPCYHLLEI